MGVIVLDKRGYPMMFREMPVLGRGGYRAQDAPPVEVPEATLSDPPQDGPTAWTLVEAASYLGLSVDEAEDRLRQAGVSRHAAFDAAGVRAVRDSAAR